MTEKRQLQQHIERTNVIYDLTKGLSTDELKALTPALLRAAIPMRDALETLLKYYAIPLDINDPLLPDFPSHWIKAGRALSLAKEG